MIACPGCHSLDVDVEHQLPADAVHLDVLYCRACGRRWAVN